MTTRCLLRLRMSQPVRGGFSMIDVVLVLAVVGLLLGAVAPSLQAARGRSKNAVCQDKLRAIGLASGVYAEWNPNNFGIPVHPLQFRQCGGQPCNPIYVGAYEWGGKSGIGQADFVTGSRDELGLGSKYGTMAGLFFGVFSGFGPATRPLNRVLYPGGFRDAWSGSRLDRVLAAKDTKLDLPAYRCPADNGPPRGGHCADWIEKHELSSYDYFGTSYAANIFMISEIGGGRMQTNSPYLRPLSRIPNPARTINFEENIGRWAWACKADPCDFIDGVDPGPTKAVRGWHGKNWTFNRVFGDAHVESQAVYLDGTEDADGFAQHYRVELVYQDNPALQDQYRCVIVRGDGWQKDTLPDEPISTQFFHGGAGRASYEGCVE